MLNSRNGGGRSDSVATMGVGGLQFSECALTGTETRGAWALAWLRQDALCVLLCLGIPLLCVLIARPFGKIAFDDDWSYSHIALKFAQTGHLQYDGWGSPTLLFQSLWAAGWIRILGFSFDLMRLITLPFSLGFVLLVYVLGRKIGLRCELALFGALTVGTAPLFLPIAASFMTDPYGCCSALCAVRVARL
jgi:hypothetical protein